MMVSIYTSLKRSVFEGPHRFRHLGFRAKLGAQGLGCKVVLFKDDRGFLNPEP